MSVVRQRVIIKNGLSVSEYAKIHRLLIKKYGKATHCSNPNCKGVNIKRFEWSLKKDHSYSECIDDYAPLCVSCHRKYDYTIAMRHNASDLRKGKCPHNRHRIVARISEEDYQLYSSVTNAALDNNMLHTSIANCLSGRSKTANGFIWKYRD
jgi:hypothetical protein